MQIPAWVDKGETTKAGRARARLKYAMGVLAARHTGRQSIRGLAERVSMDHSTLSIYIRRGAFSERAAKRMQDVFGAQEITAAFLMDPLGRKVPLD